MNERQRTLLEALFKPKTPEQIAEAVAERERKHDDYCLALSELAKQAVFQSVEAHRDHIVVGIDQNGFCKNAFGCEVTITIKAILRDAYAPPTNEPS